MNSLQILVTQEWLPRLGWTLIHFFWQGTVLAATFTVIRRAIGRSVTSQTRYILACCTLALMVLAPVLTFSVRSATPRQWAFPLQDAWPSLLPWLVLVWFIGVTLFSVRLLGGWRMTYRLRHRGVWPAQMEWQQKFKSLAERIGVSHPVRLLTSSIVEVPTVVGWLRPIVLMPVGALTGLPVSHVEALLAHELAHVRRLDYLVNLLQNIAETLLFYHPAVWWVSGQIRAERELCCDDLAVATCGDALTYARALAELESCRPVRASHAASHAMSATGSALPDRIRRLIGIAPLSGYALPGRGTAAAMTLLSLLGIGALAANGAAVRPILPPFAAAFHPAVSELAPITSGPLLSTILFGPLGPAPARHPLLMVAAEPQIPLPPVQNATGSIEGTIVNAVSGQPIRGVRVTVSGLTIDTAADGRFQLSGIPSGTQNVITSIDGYLPAPGEDRFWTLAAGQQLTGVVVRLVPNGIVSGRVLNSRGEPVAGAQIAGYREAFNNRGELELQIAMGGMSTDRTNDRGEFRIYRYVEPGEYVFRVEPPQLTPGNAGETFAPLYFPGTPDAAKAPRYTVRAGEETDLKNIVLMPSRGGTLHVRVDDQSGIQTPNNQVLLQVLRKDMGGLGVRYGPFPSGGAGKDVGRLANGTYEVNASYLVPGDGPASQNQARIEGHATIDVFDNDVDLALVLKRGPKLTGQIVAESAGGTVVPVSGVQLSFRNPRTYSSIGAISNADGAIAVASAPSGLYELGGVTKIPQGFVVKSIAAGNHDLLVEGLRISDDDIDLRVLLGPPAGTIHGTVTDSKGDRVRGATVILADPNGGKGFQASSYCHSVTSITDQNGEFELTVDRTGNYGVIAGKSVDYCAALNAEFMKKNASRIVPVHADAGIRVAVKVTLLDP